MTIRPNARRSTALLPLLGILLAACGAAAPSAVPSSALAASTPTAGPSPAPSDAASQPPDTGGTTTGDVPDNAVFLTFKDSSHAFSIKYVEGWQVTTGADGVVIHDKDSSETVTLVAAQTDVPAYISGTDLPALRALAGFTLIKQDTVNVGTRTYDHLAYKLVSPPDPVTGKQIPSTVDRYYVAGTAGLAVVSLSSPDGVDNVDAFRLMIESFTWS